MASDLERELPFLILQFLHEKNFKGAAHCFEQESRIYFNMRHFEEMVSNGDLDKAEKYLSGFTKVDDNMYSMRILFEIRKQKYLEALDRNDRDKAVEILSKELKMFSIPHEDVYKGLALAHLITLDNFREHERLSTYVDAKSARNKMVAELKNAIAANPMFRDKLQFPNLRNSRLRTLVNQGLNWQHLKCKNPKPDPEIRTLFTDHNCGEPTGHSAPSPDTSPSTGRASKRARFPLIGPYAPFQTTTGQRPLSLAGWVASQSAAPHYSASASSGSLATPNNPEFGPSEPVMFNEVRQAMINRPRASGSPARDYPTPNSAISDEVGAEINPPNPISPDELPRNVVMTLNQGSSVKSMDFHPVEETLLLVGTDNGYIMIWQIVTREMLVQRSFMVWDFVACSMALQAILTADYTISVNRVIWSPDGLFFGVAFSKNIVHIYSYQCKEIRNHLEIEAHTGSVNDMAFAYPDNHMIVITCGEDRLTKVWDANSGASLVSCEGHAAPVYSVCPHQTGNVLLILSAATDGKIKGWIYRSEVSIIDFDAPGRSSMMLAFTANRARLFSCGTNREGESHLVEWDVTEGGVIRSYNGLARGTETIVQFDTSKNRILAAGDESVIKFWDMNTVDMLTTADANGGLPASPCLRFNKEGMFLAVSTNDNGIKILANVDGMRMLQDMDECATIMANIRCLPARGFINRQRHAKRRA